MAPEIIENKSHDYKTDIWALGVTLFFMIFRCFPFNSRKNRLSEIKKHTTPYYDLTKQMRGHTSII